MELVDIGDSKSPVLTDVAVQVRPLVPNFPLIYQKVSGSARKPQTTPSPPKQSKYRQCVHKVSTQFFIALNLHFFSALFIM